MKKLTMLLVVLLVLATVCPLFAGGGSDNKGGGGTRIWRLADNQPDGYPTVLGDLAFAKYVGEKTNGAIKVEVYNNSVLGDEKTTIEQTQTNVIQLIRVGINPLTSTNPLMAALGMPFLYRDREHMFKVLDGQIGQEMLESLQSQNLLGLCWFDAGFRNFYNARREIKSPDDMRGLKIRVQESALMMDMIRFLGAQPTPMAYPEVYPGMQNGVIDGAENNWPSYITAAHFEVAKFFTEDGHMASPEMILINTQTFNALTDAEKKIVKDAAAEGAKVERAEWLAAEKKYEQQAKDAGCTITYLTAAEKQKFADALNPLYSQPAYAQYSDLIRRIRAVQ